MPGTSAFEVEADARSEGDQQKKQMIFGGVGVVVVIAVIIGHVSLLSGKKDLKLRVAEVESFENDFKNSFVLTDPKKGTNEVGGKDNTKKQQHPDVVGLNVKNLLKKLNVEPTWKMSKDELIKDAFKSDVPYHAVIAKRDAISQGFVKGALCDGRDYPLGEPHVDAVGEGPDRVEFDTAGLFSGLDELVIFAGGSRPNEDGVKGTVKEKVDGKFLEYREFFLVMDAAKAKTLQKKLDTWVVAKVEKDVFKEEIKKFLEGNLFKRSEVEVLSSSKKGTSSKSKGTSPEGGSKSKMKPDANPASESDEKTGGSKSAEEVTPKEVKPEEVKPEEVNPEGSPTSKSEVESEGVTPEETGESTKVESKSREDTGTGGGDGGAVNPEGPDGANADNVDTQVLV